METEKYLSGYCRVLDHSRLVEVVLEDGSVTEVDCGFPACSHRSNCTIARQIEDLQNT